MMDVVPLPARKKPNFLKATKEQLDILMAGFAVSGVSSKPHLTALGEATGLPSPIKWIASWFTRQRKKVANASGYVDMRDNATNERVESHKNPTTVAVMSVQEISSFKTEYIEPAPLGTLALSADSEPERKPVLSQKPIKKTRKPTKKRKSKPTPYPPSSPLKPPFVSAPLSSGSVLSSSVYHSLEAQPQPTDSASPTSTFILREMVPVAYKPKPLKNDWISPPATAIDPPLSEGSEAFSPSLSAGHPTVAIVSNAIAPLHPDPSVYHPATSSSTDCITKVLSVDTDACHLGCVHPWQNSAGNHQEKDSKTTIQKLQESLNLFDTLKPSVSTSAQRKPMPCIDRTLRPLLPLNSPPCNTVSASHQYLYHYSQALLEMQAQDNRNTKENLLIHPQRASSTSSKLRSSGPRILPPLFTTTDLTITRDHQLAQSTTIDDDPASIVTSAETSQQHSLVTEAASLPLVVQDEDEIRLDDNQPVSFFDSTTAPLKYLDVLVPFPDESLSTDEMMSRLLNPQLAEEDPFQAAMGLVFASQLGLHWDYT